LFEYKGLITSTALVKVEAEQMSPEPVRAAGNTAAGGQPDSSGNLARDRRAKGLVILVLTTLVLIAGIVGYVRYDELVEPHLPVYVCCLPSAIIAFALIFFGFITRFTIVRRAPLRPAPEQPVSPEPSRPPAGQHQGARKIHKRELTGTPEGAVKGRSEKVEKLSASELAAKKKKVEEFISDLDNQFKDGLLMEESYRMLQNKYKNELAALERMERELEARKKQ
jgi:hypothetical protein